MKSLKKRYNTIIKNCLYFVGRRLKLSERLNQLIRFDLMWYASRVNRFKQNCNFIFLKLQKKKKQMSSSESRRVSIKEK